MVYRERDPGIRIKVSAKECNGCLSCMTVCSMVNESYASLSGARLQVTLSPFEGAPKITTRRQCVKAACVQACPTGAIRRDAEGCLVVAYERCVAQTDGCRECIVKCPFHAMFWNAVADKIERLNELGLNDVANELGACYSSHFRERV